MTLTAEPRTRPNVQSVDRAVRVLTMSWFKLFLRLRRKHPGAHLLRRSH